MKGGGREQAPLFKDTSQEWQIPIALTSRCLEFSDMVTTRCLGGWDSGGGWVS